MTGSPLLLGIDLGTSSVKVIVTGLDGAVLGSGAGGYEVDRPLPGWAEQSPDAWWAAIVAAAGAALGQAENVQPLARGAIAAIGVAGQMHGTVLIDAAHRPVASAVIWPDQRSGDAARGITRAVGADRMIGIAGAPLASGFQAPTLRWLRDHRPDLLERATWVLGPKDAVRLRLTGEVATDPGDASGTGCFDVTRREWSPVVAEAAGIDVACLPPVRPSASRAGALRAAAAADLGLRAGIPVATGTADTPAGLLGAGLTRPGAFLLTISSGGQLMVPVADPASDPSGRSSTLCSALPVEAGLAPWYRMAAILSAGLALRWLRDAVLGMEGPDAYERMLALIDAVPPGSRGLVFLPYLAGERNPHLDSAARGAFIGLTPDHGRPELVRAVVEGITLGCLDACPALWARGGPPESIVLAGGGSRSRAWRHVVADAFGMPVRHLESGEQAALGACLLGGAATGLLDLVPAAASWARLGPPIAPDLDRHAVYAQLLDVFRDGYPRLRDTFPRLRAIEATSGGPISG